MRVTRSTATCALAVGLVVALGACADSKGTAPPSGVALSANVADGQTTTPAGTKPLATLTWYGDYRPVYSLDPAKNADYPEETILPNVCTSLVQIDASQEVKPSLATAWQQVSPTSLIFTIRDGVTFSDGSPLTVDDVVFSLNRNRDPEVASAFSDGYKQVSSITATGANQVTVTFSSPDTTFVYAAATLGGAVVSRRYAESKGKDFGTPQGGVLCAGPYQVESYDGTHDLTLAVNEHYWDSAHAPKAANVRFVFPSDPGALVNAISSGTIQGAFNVPPTAVTSLGRSSTGKLYVGGSASSPQTVGIVPSSVTNGPLADKRVRQALGLAVNRAAVADKVWAGAAQPLYSFAGPGLFGPSKAALQPTYDALTVREDVAKAKSLVAAAGATSATIRLAYPSDVDFITTLATYLQQVGKQIGLDVKLVGQPSSQFGNLFVDAGARSQVDAFITINYLEFPSPAAMIQSFAVPGGFQNYEGYDNPALTALIDQALASPVDKQADPVNKAQAILGEDLPWIPLVAPRMTLYSAKTVTGGPLNFSFMTSPWLTQVGGS